VLLPVPFVPNHAVDFVTDKIVQMVKKIRQNSEKVNCDALRINPFVKTKIAFRINKFLRK